jgi:hypothetical protein
MVIVIGRNVALDLVDYWGAVDAVDPDSEFSLDNEECIGDVRLALAALSQALAAGPEKKLVVEVEAGPAEEIFDQADNCLDIALSQIEDAEDEAVLYLGPDGLKRLKNLASDYKRLLKQKDVALKRRSLYR